MFRRVDDPINTVVDHEAGGCVWSKRRQRSVVIKDQEDEVWGDTDQEGTEHVEEILRYLDLTP